MNPPDDARADVVVSLRAAALRTETIADQIRELRPASGSDPFGNSQLSATVGAFVQAWARAVTGHAARVSALADDIEKTYPHQPGGELP
jgi:hypothetical protein